MKEELFSPLSCYRVKTLEDRIEPLTTDHEVTLDGLTESWTSHLDVIKADLDSCHDCWDETVTRLERKPPKQDDQSKLRDPWGGSLNIFC